MPMTTDDGRHRHEQRQPRSGEGVEDAADGAERPQAMPMRQASPSTVRRSVMPSDPHSLPVLAMDTRARQVPPGLGSA